MNRYAINYVLGSKTRTMVTTAEDPDAAYDAFRACLHKRWLVSASLQGSPRIATDADEAIAEHDCLRDARAHLPVERVSTWKVETTSDGIVLHLNGYRFKTNSGESMAFEIQRAALGYNAPADEREEA